MRIKKLLVLVADYPNLDNGVSMMYVHTRNCFYRSHGLHVTVINFSAEQNYIIDDIPVITLQTYENSHDHYDVLVLHAANIRNHYLFLKKYQERFEKIFFYYHGHEVLKIHAVYPAPYDYVKKNSAAGRWLQDAYDELKLFIWRRYLPSLAEKSCFVFVSQWMENEFLKWTRIPAAMLQDRSCIIYNSVDETFQSQTYDVQGKKNYDFITIRDNLDDSKCAIDFVSALARNTPEKKFLVIGKGSYFTHRETPENLTWKNTVLKHEEIPSYLNQASFALMPTRTDAQGLMMCEMAAFGIPVITSDIPVCHEVFGNFENVYYIDNEEISQNLSQFTREKSVCRKHTKFFRENTADREVRLYL